MLALLSIKIKKIERHAAQAPALRERFNKSSIFNLQSSIPACRVGNLGIEGNRSI